MTPDLSKPATYLFFGCMLTLGIIGSIPTAYASYHATITEELGAIEWFLRDYYHYHPIKWGVAVVIAVAVRFILRLPLPFVGLFAFLHALVMLTVLPLSMTSTPVFFSPPLMVISTYFGFHELLHMFLLGLTLPQILAPAFSGWLALYFAFSRHRELPYPSN